MGFGLIDMGKLSPLDPFPLLWILSPQIFVCVHLQLVIHFIHYIQFTSFTYYIALALGHTLHLQYITIYIASLGFENGDVTFPSPYKLHCPQCT
jgi:hypothetical protein